jgi:putative ABC transport system substrate-binding protein
MTAPVPASCSRIRAAAAVAAVACVAALGSHEAVAKPAYETWFHVAPVVLENWQLTEVSSDPNQVFVSPRYAPPTVGRKRILVLFPSASSAYDVAMSTVLDVFAERRLAAEFTAFTFGGQPDAGRQAISIAEAGYHMILAMGSKSAAWLWDNYKGKRLPVVSICAKDPVMLGQMPDYKSGSGTNFAFTSLNAPLELQMGYVMEIKPALKNVGILVDNNNISAVETQAKPLADHARKNGIEAFDVGVDGPSRAAEELATGIKSALEKMRKTDPQLENSVFWVTGSTAVFKEMKTINEIAGKVPVLSVVPELVKAGADSAVLSIGVSFESNARLAAVYMERVLTGRTDVGDLKVGMVSPPDIAINMSKAKEIGLRIPFSWFESASHVYDNENRLVRTSSRLFAGKD